MNRPLSTPAGLATSDTVRKAMAHVPNSEPPPSGDLGFDLPKPAQLTPRRAINHAATTVLSNAVVADKTPVS